MMEHEILEELEAARPQEDADERFMATDGWLDVDVTPYLLDFSTAYEAPRFVLSLRGVGFAPLGGIHALTGQSGHGKTMTLAQFIAAILGGEYGELRYELADTIPRPKVLYIDTEMEQSNTIAMKNRVLTMVGRPINEEQDDFKVLMLREVASDTAGVTAAQIRWQMILKAIYELRPTVCFIDGLLDIVHDFNSNQECQELIYKCMQVASHYGISLWCLVHQNPGGEKLVGHLGSMLERKVTDIFVTAKEKAPSGEVTFSVTQKKARGCDVPEWHFRVTPEGGWGLPEQVATQTDVKANGDSPEQIRQWLAEGQHDIEWPATLKDIKKMMSAHGGPTNTNSLQADITIARNRRFIIAQPDAEMEKGQRMPRFYLNPAEYNNTKHNEYDLF